MRGEFDSALTLPLKTPADSAAKTTNICESSTNV